MRLCATRTSTGSARTGATFKPMLGASHCLDSCAPMPKSKPTVLVTAATQATHQGVIRQFIGDARISWVDGDDVALVASRALLQPQLHAGQTYRLGYDAKSYAEVAAIMTAVLGQLFRYEAQPPEVFLEEMRAAGAEMAYMACVYDSFKRTASGAIPGVDQIFDNFKAITGRQPVRWEEFVRKHRTTLAY